MKNNKLILLGIFFFSVLSYAQPRFKEKKEQIKALKVAFITNELALTPNEAAAFWPLYNAYDNRQNEIRFKKIKSFIDRMDSDAIDKMSEKDASLLLAQSENLEEEIYQNRKKFIQSIKDVLPSVKIIKLKKSEDNFNRKLLQQYRDRGPKD